MGREERASSCTHAPNFSRVAHATLERLAGQLCSRRSTCGSDAVIIKQEQCARANIVSPRASSSQQLAAGSRQTKNGKRPSCTPMTTTALTRRAHALAIPLVRSFAWVAGGCERGYSCLRRPKREDAHCGGATDRLRPLALARSCFRRGCRGASHRAGRRRGNAAQSEAAKTDEITMTFAKSHCVNSRRFCEFISGVNSSRFLRIHAPPQS